MNLQLVNEQDVTENLEEGAATPTPSSYRKISNEEREALRERVETVKKDFENHKYLLDVSADHFEKYKLFIKNDAVFDGKDCLGIPKIFDALNDSEKEAVRANLGGKAQYMLTNMHLEALYYYLTKVDGKGYDEAMSLKSLLDPVIASLSRAVVRRNVLQSFLEKAEAQLHGIIDPDEEIAPEYENESLDGEN